MEAGGGQRRDGGAAPPCPGRAPAVVVHAPGQARAALDLAGPRGVVLLSPPGAAGGMGAAWFLALVAEARAAAAGSASAREPPPHWAALDCADAPGSALAALRAGARLLVLDPAAPAFPAVTAAAAEVGAAVWPARPPALDLGARFDPERAAGGRRRLAEWLTGASVTNPPSGG